MSDGKTKKRYNYVLMVQCALFVALSAAGAFIRIPIPLMPFTLQFMFTNLAGILLGKKYGTVSVALYVAIGLVGIPVFTGGGGPAYVFNPTFGYLIGMCAGAYVAGFVRERAGNFEFKATFIGGLLNMMVVYLIGFPYFAVIMKLYMDSDTAMGTLFATGCLMTLPADVLKCLVSSMIAKRIGNSVQSYQLENH